MDGNEERQAALEAGRLMANPLVKEAFAALDDSFVTAWRNGKTTEDRERAWTMQALLGKLQSQILHSLQNMALNARGKDEDLNAALKAAKAPAQRKAKEKKA